MKKLTEIGSFIKEKFSTGMKNCFNSIKNAASHMRFNEVYDYIEDEKTDEHDTINEKVNSNVQLQSTIDWEAQNAINTTNDFIRGHESEDNDQNRQAANTSATSQSQNTEENQQVHHSHLGQSLTEKYNTDQNKKHKNQDDQDTSGVVTDADGEKRDLNGKGNDAWSEPILNASARFSND